MTELSDPTRGASSPTTLWTTNNTAEAAPEVLSPLCTSFWCDRLEYGNRAALYDFGIIEKGELIPPADKSGYASGCFYGHVTINVDRAAFLMDRLPGSSGADFERFILGHVREDREPAPPLPLPRRALGGARAVMTTIRNPPLARKLYADTHAWWQQTVYSAAPATDPGAVLREAGRRFEYAMRILGRSRYSSQILQVRIMRILAAASLESLAGDLFMGYGDVTEGTMVRELSQVAAGERTLEAFLQDFGFYGPSTGIVYTRSWREDPALLDSMLRQMQVRGSEHAEDERVNGARARREIAEKQLIDATAPASRSYVQQLLKLAGGQVRSIERGKAAYLMANDVARYAARELGKQLTAAGVMTDPEDPFFLTAEEIDRLSATAPAELIAFRRARYAANKETEIPPSFVGMPEPITSKSEAAQAFTSLTGMGVSPGVVEGTARIVRDPFGIDDLAPGDIVVCRVTDPSWAPVFALAGGLVIDIGSPASHGAIVAREFGVPCVINSRTGTRDIPDGARIRIDGTTGDVTPTNRGRPVAARLKIQPGTE